MHKMHKQGKDMDMCSSLVAGGVFWMVGVGGSLGKKIYGRDREPGRLWQSFDEI